MAIPNSDAFNWIIGPVTRAVTYVVDETKLAGTIHRSMVVLEGNETFLRVARERLEAAGAREGVQGIDKLLAEAPMLSRWAAEFRKNDFSLVNSHSLIGMWGAVEVAVEDTVILILSKDPAALGVVASAGVKTTNFGPGPVSEEDGKRLYSRLERQLRENLKVGEAYQKMLGLFGVTFSCSNHVLSKLEEINSVRNCLLHRGGIIDDKAAQSVGALRPLLGKQIPITSARYQDYYAAVSAFLQAMLNGVLGSSYVRAAPQPQSNT